MTNIILSDRDNPDRKPIPKKRLLLKYDVSFLSRDTGLTFTEIILWGHGMPDIDKLVADRADHLNSEVESIVFLGARV